MDISRYSAGWLRLVTERFQKGRSLPIRAPSRERLLTVHSRHSVTYGEWQLWVDSGLLVTGYISRD